MPAQIKTKKQAHTVKQSNLNTRTSIAGYDGLYQRSNKILIKFRWEGKTHYQSTGLDVTKPNCIASMRKLADIQKQITMGLFDFTQAFPSARKSKQVATGATHTILDVAAIWFERWQEYNPLAAPNTVKTYKYCIKHHLAGLGVCAVNKLTTEILKNWYTNLRNVRTGEKLSAKRKANIITTARHIFREAKTSGLFDSPTTPFDAFEDWLKSLDGVKASDRFEAIDPAVILTKIERDQILSFGKDHTSVIHPNDLNMIGFNLSCGLRLGELFGLTWDCIDFDKRTVHVKRQLSEGDYKGVKTYVERTLALSNESIEWLKRQQPITRMLDAIEIQYLTNEKDKKGQRVIEQRRERFVFLNPAFDMSRPYYRSDSFASRWYNILNAAGVPAVVGKAKRKRSANTMRHTFASRLLTNGATVEDCARLLGNTPPACKKHYARVIPDEQTVSDHDLVNSRLAGS